MRYLIFDGGCWTGTNFSRQQPAPVGHDIAHFLFSYTAILRSSDDFSAGQVILSDAIAAFFSGYTLVGIDDPSVQFLPYAKILATLACVLQWWNE